MEAQALAEACAKALWDDDRASRGVGMTLERVGPGEAMVSMTITEAMVNGHGTCHGGFIFTLADSAFAFACNGYNDRTVAQHCSITYLRPAKLGEKLTALGLERSRANRSGIYDIAVRNAEGVVVAEFRGHSRTIGGAIVATDGDPG